MKPIDIVLGPAGCQVATGDCLDLMPLIDPGVARLLFADIT